MPIPRVLHRVWLGDKPLPESGKIYHQRFLALHPSWQVILWDDAAVNALPFDKTIYAKSPNIGVKSDIARYEILKARGGVYADYDIWFYRPIDSVLSLPAFAGNSGPSALYVRAICNAILGCSEHNAFMQVLCDELQFSAETVFRRWQELGREATHVATGSGLLTRMAARCSSLIHVFEQPVLHYDRRLDNPLPQTLTSHDAHGTWRTAHEPQIRTARFRA